MDNSTMRLAAIVIMATTLLATEVGCKKPSRGADGVRSVPAPHVANGEGLVPGHHPPIRAERVYRLHGLKYSPYATAVLTLGDISPNKISGKLSPLLGDNTTPIPVSGSTSGTHLTLQFDLPTGHQVVDLNKSSEDLNENSDDYSTDDKNTEEWKSDDGNVSMYRGTDGGFSTPALTYDILDGAEGIWFNWKVGVSYKDAERYMKGQSPILSLPTSMWSRSKNDIISVPLSDAILATHNESPNRNTYVQNDDEHSNIEVPIQAEVDVVQFLRRSGLFSWVDKVPYERGAAEVTYFVINKSIIYDGNGVSKTKLTSAVDSIVSKYASRGNAYKYEITSQRAGMLNLPTPIIYYQVRVFVASEISRHVKGFWDTFVVTFKPYELTTTSNNTVAVEVVVERLKTNRRSLARSSPPDLSYFTTELDEEVEGVVAESIARQFGLSLRGRCLFDLETVKCARGAK